MGKHLLELVWDIPASFALPSVAACRRGLEIVRARSSALRLAYGDRRSAPRLPRPLRPA